MLRIGGAVYPKTAYCLKIVTLGNSLTEISMRLKRHKFRSPQYPPVIPDTPASASLKGAK